MNFSTSIMIDIATPKDLKECLSLIKLVTLDFRGSPEDGFLIFTNPETLRAIFSEGTVFIARSSRGICGMISGYKSDTLLYEQLLPIMNQVEWKPCHQQINTNDIVYIHNIVVHPDLRSASTAFQLWKAFKEYFGEQIFITSCVESPWSNLRIPKILHFLKFKRCGIFKSSFMFEFQNYQAGIYIREKNIDLPPNLESEKK